MPECNWPGAASPNNACGTPSDYVLEDESGKYFRCEKHYLSYDSKMREMFRKLTPEELADDDPAIGF